MNARLPPESLHKLQSVSIEDKFALERGRAFMTGTQALVRLPMLQRQRDIAAGLDTAAFISGYRGSPLGGLDRGAGQASKYYEALGIRMHPGVNEDLAATSIWGTQQVNLYPGAKHRGVLGMWYGKSPGLDRSGDPLKHANMAGTSPFGGVLMLVGDDHGAKSSSLAHQSDQSLKAYGIPVLYPASVQEMLDYGLHAWEMSRYTGLWIAMKCVTDIVETAAAVELDPDRPRILLPQDHRLPAGGLGIRWPDPPLEQEARMVNFKWPAALAYAAANGLNRIVWPQQRPRFGIVTTGKSYLDTRQALADLGITEALAAELGLQIFKVGMTWPLERAGALAFARGLEEILVVEEKLPFIEPQFKDALYDIEGKRPRVVGKFDETGSTPLLSSVGELSPASIARVIATRLRAALQGHPALRVIEERIAYLEAKDAMFMARIKLDPERDRIHTFCSGCPHNTSTQVPEGSRAMAGIGCHMMAVRLLDRRTSAPTHMGGEGAPWIGQAPFTNEKHIFVNLGDGTYYHSGIAAIRAAVAGKVNLTYKILYNDAVAMTGGQPVDGPLDPGMISRQLAAEGVAPIIVVTDEPDKYLAGYGWAPGVTVHHRSKLDAVQRQLRECPGVSALIYDQTCAAEKRRRRKKGLYPDPPKRTVINEAVCEGCGDCSVQSNCLSVEPLETDFGRKRKINQSTCNKDFSCTTGFCPSFVTVEGGQLRSPAQRPIRTANAAATAEDGKPPSPPCLTLDAPYDILVTGVGGTGVITIGQIVAMAAHLEGKACSVLDMTGAAQKGGTVMSHVRLAPRAEDLHCTRVGVGAANLVIGCDLIVTATRDALMRMREGATHAVVNLEKTPTSAFMKNPDWQYPGAQAQKDIDTACGGGVDFIEATEIALALMGDSIATNMFIVGYAWQKGWIPLGEESLMRAIELNGAGIASNKQAFAWGRQGACDLAALRKVIASLPSAGRLIEFKRPGSLEEVIARRVEFLTGYQHATYANTYRAFVERVRAVETAVLGQSEPLRLTEAVAKYLFKLMAYKDEYEVARLLSDPAFRAKLNGMFEGSFKISYHLAPPLLAKRDGDGHLVKKEYGPWMGYAMCMLASLKFLRGGAFDVFGRSAERRTERTLISQYRDIIDSLLSRLTVGNLDVATAIASVPEEIRGYGHVKEKNLLAATQKREQLLRDFDVACGAADPSLQQHGRRRSS
jgi:indolepyruvate ferredoxin oxidoreductase